MTFHSVGNGKSSQMTFTPSFLRGVRLNHQPVLVDCFWELWIFQSTNDHDLDIIHIYILTIYINHIGNFPRCSPPVAATARLANGREQVVVQPANGASGETNSHETNEACPARSHGFFHEKIRISWDLI